MWTMNSQELLKAYQQGHSEAATAIFDRYVARLIALARNRIGPKLRRRLDAEDVVQSAYRSFFLHAKDDEYRVANSGELWRLLASITLNKLYGQIEKHTAAKRNFDREEPIDLLVEDAKTPEPSPAEVIAILEETHLVIGGLLSDEQTVLISRLQGQSIEEISQLIGKSERTTRRLLAEAKRQIEQRLMSDDPKIAKQRPPVIDPEATLHYSDYTLDKLLGSGGMGKVFRAREAITGKKVAIKALHKARQSDHRAVAQFVKEAQILAKLSHPNIVGVKGLGRFPGGGYFIVMDFVDGVDLQSRLKHGPLRLSEATRIVRQVANAVQHAHDQGIVHCDLKPGNILLHKNGLVIVTDFGFAYIVAGERAMSGQHIGGTEGYIAPEILLQRSLPTPAADMYALGMLLWSLVTGKSPNDLICLDTKGSSPDKATSICLRCIAEDVRERYSSPSELLQDLDYLDQDSKKS